MKAVRSSLKLFLVFLFLTMAADSIQAQDRGKEQDKDRRIRELEQRLNRLEKIVFATSKLTVLEAERQLNRARQRFDHSERLHIRGWITDRQFAQDRFELQLAVRELELARNANGSRRISMQIDFMRAENRLRVAKDTFERTLRLRNRGYSSRDEIESSRKEISIAEKNLEVARMRLEAISKPIGKQENKAEPPKSKKSEKKKTD